MKFSKFNSVIPLEGKYSILFNAYTKMYIIFDSLLEEQLVNEQIGYLQEKFPLLFSKLLEAKCIIDNDIDELQLLKEKSYLANNKYDEYMIFINPTLDCNFRCWYCYEKHKKNSRMDENMMEQVKKLIKKKIQDEKIKKYIFPFLVVNPC